MMPNDVSPAAALAPEQVAAYRRDGFIVVPDLLDGGELSRLLQVIAGLAAGAAAVETHTDIYDLEPGHTRAAPRVRRIKTPHKVHPAFDAWCASPPCSPSCTRCSALPCGCTARS